MKTKATLALLCILQTFICLGCKDENLQQKATTQTEVNNETQNISEEKTAAITTIKTITNKESKENNEDQKSENLMDTQAKVYTDIFGKLGGVEELQGIESYMDLVKKMDASPATKKQLTAQYELYANSLDPEKKEALKKELLEALKPKK